MSARTILNPPISLSSGNAEIDVSQVAISSSNGGVDYSLTSYSNTLSIACPTTATPTIQIGNTNDYVQLKCPSDNTLQLPQLQVNSETGNVVTLSAISTDYLSLNGGNLQGANLNATAGVQCAGTLNMSDSQGSADIVYTYPYLTINTPLGVGNYVNAPYYTGGLYNAIEVFSPPRAIPAYTGTSDVIVVIPWNPTANWTTTTVTVVQSLVTDYPTVVTGVGLVKISSNQLQITFFTANTGTQPSNLYSVSYIVANQQN